METNEQIKQIAARLAGLREALNLSLEEMAKSCNQSVEEYKLLESGTTDISVSVLHQISMAYGVELTTLMFGDEPKMSSYFVTRKGQGISVERFDSYKYQTLAAGFAKRKADPFIVTVHPKEEEEAMHLNCHPGQEFNMVLSGRLLLNINGKEIVLEEGDSIYFDGMKPHGMKALGGKKVSFFAIIV